MENEKTELQTTEGIFIGYEQVSSGTISKGKNVGKPWTRFKAKFKPKEDSQKSFSFSVFSPLTAKNTKQLEDLKIGTRYKVLYKENSFTANSGEAATSKTVVGFYSPDDAKAAVARVAQKSESLDLSKFDEWKVRYFAAMKEANLKPNLGHMIGSFMQSFQAEKVAALKVKCEEALK